MHSKDLFQGVPFKNYNDYMISIYKLKNKIKPVLMLGARSINNYIELEAKPDSINLREIIEEVSETN